MITRNRVHTRVERHGGHRNEVNPAHCVLAVFVTSKGISNPRKSGAGMSTYLALTFGTLLSSQGTDTSFGPPSSGPSGRFALSCFKLTRCFPARLPDHF